MSDDARLDPGRLKALAHPLRLQLRNALSAFGPDTASGLAERFGESSGATSYHLRQLERYGFIRERREEGSRRERWWEVVPGPLALDIDDYPAGSAEREAALVVSNEWIREREAETARFLGSGSTDFPAEWHEHARLQTALLHLTLEQFQALSAELDTVVSRWVETVRDQQGEGFVPVRVHADAFPVADRARRPADGAAR